MREHKYKAWDKTNNQWYMDGNVFDLNYSGSYGDFYFDNDNPYNMREVELEWVQFTGLKDKNGKMIFEGDILSDEEGLKGNVYFWQTKACFVFGGTDDEMDDWRDTFDLYGKNDLEVIGNIYQDSHLLEGEK